MPLAKAWGRHYFSKACTFERLKTDTKGSSIGYKQLWGRKEERKEGRKGGREGGREGKTKEK
jgi:hypothetical protein